MNRPVAAMVAVTVLIASAGAGVGSWRWVRHGGPSHPEISAYSHGQLTRVGPFMYCNVLNLNECQNPQTQGTLRVNDRDPIQLSVPSTIGTAPWRLVQVYENPIDTTTTLFRPDARLAVTIPTADPQRGRLHGFAVQLMTLVQDESGELHEVPHAEWSVKTVWN